MHQPTSQADVAPPTRSTSPEQTQGATAPTSALPIEAAPSVEPVLSVEEGSIQDEQDEDEIVRRPARLARRERRVREEAARVEEEARSERKRARRLAREQQDREEGYEGLSVDEDGVPLRRERKRQRTTLRQPADEAPRIKQESPGVFARIAQLVQIKQEPESRAQAPAAKHQVTSQPEIGIKQEARSRVSTPEPQHRGTSQLEVHIKQEPPSRVSTPGTQRQGIFQSQVHTEQRSPFHGFRSRTGPQSPSSDEAEVESQDDEGSSSPAPVRELEVQAVFNLRSRLDSNIFVTMSSQGLLLSLQKWRWSSRVRELCISTTRCSGMVL